MRTVCLKSNPQICFIERDAYSLKEVAEYIAKGGGGASSIVKNSGIGLAKQEDIPPFEEMVRKMQPGDKLLRSKALSPNSGEIPTGILVDVEELQELKRRYIFLVRIT